MAASPSGTEAEHQRVVLVDADADVPNHLSVL